ncbi:MAG TPA: saccharopine dehydrogenase NADP-binding domain-containing protein [Frankiaceae bacterium]|nr:saccharopine dehydrogenase NADP-binding domain-containing protein [Frankiaceae bacterium]
MTDDRIVLFGATGYTGRLTAEALVRRGARPVLAGRNRDSLNELATTLGGLDVAVADVAEPATVDRLVADGAVLVTTVGPFVRYGAPAVESAVKNGATYIDSTGEPGFIRQVFEEYGPRAQSPLLTAFGYDYVPGNLAAAAALDAAGDAATRVDVGYFTTGKSGFSAGTFASLTSSGPEAFAFRDGALRDERSAARVASFDVDGQQRDGVSVGSSEHFTLPRIAPGLREVNAYLGWFGNLSRAVQAGSAVADKVPGVEAAMRAFMKAVPKPSPGSGPDEETRRQGGSHVVAIAYDAAGTALSTARAVGVDGYTFTAEVLAWAAISAASGGVRGTGALGPVEAFGLDALRDGCASAGLTVG